MLEVGVDDLPVLLSELLETLSLHCFLQPGFILVYLLELSRRGLYQQIFKNMSSPHILIRVLKLHSVSFDHLHVLVKEVVVFVSQPLDMGYLDTLDVPLRVFGAYSSSTRAT